ncbi:MAG: hypothetical protein KDA84_26110, partial [Planctomycetaceae bacterium]|nr:hypothetical protein [Planctomycetaceae bacterium]
MLERVTTHRTFQTMLFLMGGLLTTAVMGEEKPTRNASALKQLDTDILATQKNADQLERMLYEDSRTRLRAANRRETNAWKKIENQQDWEDYRNLRITALRQSLGSLPDLGTKPVIKTTGEIQGTGYRIEKIL